MCGKTLLLFVTYPLVIILNNKNFYTNFMIIMVSKLFRHFIFLFLFVVIAPLLTFAEDNKISELACFIEPYITVNLGSGVTGILKEISVERGDFVKKGQVLVRLDSSVEESNLALTRARSEMVATY